MRNFDIRFYASIFLRRFPYFAIIVALVSALGFAVAYTLPPTYRANARILVESPQISTDLVRPTVSAQITKQMQIIELQMMTRANLLALSDRFGLYRDAPDASESDIVDDMRSRMNVEEVQSDGSRSKDGALAFAVSYKSQNPVLAADVVNEFVRLIVKRNAEIRTEQASEALKFFQQETEKLGDKLAEIGNEISKFKKEHSDALPESLSFRRSQQMAQEDKLMQLGREDASLRDGRSRLLQMYASTGRIANAPVLTPEEQTLEQLRKVLIEQRTIYSDASPGIIALKAQISALEQAAKAKRANEPEVSGEKAVPPELALQLADINRRLALNADEKKAIENSLSSLSRTIAATPGNEAALNALERQYQNIQTQYNAAVGRLAEAATGERIEQRSKGERLSILELAAPPQRPIGPKRLMIAAGGLVAAVMLGFGFVILLELLNNTIRRPIELVDVLELEPLATIPYIPAGDEAHSTGLKLIPATFRRLPGA